MLFRCARQPAKPIPAKPSRIIAQVDGSGIAFGTLATQSLTTTPEVVGHGETGINPDVGVDVCSSNCGATLTAENAVAGTLRLR
jgi:hypothetical protein